MQCAIIVFLLPMFALVSRVVGKYTKNVQLSIQPSAGKNSFAADPIGSPVANQVFHTFLRINALDSPIPRPWSHYKLHSNVKTKVNLLCFAQRWLKRQHFN